MSETSSEPIGKLMSVTPSEQTGDSVELARHSEQAVEHVELTTTSDQAVEHVELATTSDQIVESGVMLVESEMVTPSSDLNENATITRSQTRLVSGNNDSNNDSVTLSHDKNRMLKGIDMIKFKEIQQSNGSLQALFLKAKQNDSRYCISNDLLYERESEAWVNVVIVEEEGDVEEVELPLVGDVERDSGEFIVGERLTRQQRGQL